MIRTPIFAPRWAVLASTTALLAVLVMLALASPAGGAPKPKPQCADRIDNDLDGAIDASRRGGDPDCESRTDNSETSAFECVDLDGDGTRESPPPAPNARLGCNLLTGAVSLRECEPGYVDLDGDLQNGCEYGPIEVTGPETCDGIDNDADGSVDEGLVFSDVPNGFLVCQQGAVGVICNDGFVDANADPLDGCEVAAVAARSRDPVV